MLVTVPVDTAGGDQNQAVDLDQEGRAARFEAMRSADSATRRSDPKVSVHSSKGRLLVIRMAPCS